MLVSHRHRFIYTKTTKTGGTSVESYFEPYCMADGEWTQAHARDEYASASGIVGFRGTAPPPGTLWWNHMPAWKIRDQLGMQVWAGYFKFCVVRNPFDKAISNFYFQRSQRLIEVDASTPDAVQFEHWLASGGAKSDRDKYLIDGEICMDYIARYETLAIDMERICARLALPWEPGRLPTFKAGIRPAWAVVEALYSPRAEDIVRKAYAYELDAFGYSFGSPGSPTSPVGAERQG